MERRPTRQNFYLWSDPRTATATSGNYLDRDTDLPPSKKLGKISRGGPPTVHLASKTRKNPRNNLSVRINEFGTICFFHKREKKRSKYILHSTDTSAVLSRMNAKRFTILFPQSVMYRQSIFRSLEIETTTLETVFAWQSVIVVEKCPNVIGGNVCASLFHASIQSLPSSHLSE